MKYVAVLALLTLAACAGQTPYSNGSIAPATNYVPNGGLGTQTWTGQEPYSPSEYAL